MFASFVEVHVEELETKDGAVANTVYEVVESDEDVVMAENRTRRGPHNACMQQYEAWATRRTV